MTGSSNSSNSRHEHGLSKSRIAAFEQCPKRLWLLVHKPELADLDPTKALRLSAGHEVGDAACSLVRNRPIGTACRGLSCVAK
jgi:hypothetical protein